MCQFKVNEVIGNPVSHINFGVEWALFGVLLFPLFSRDLRGASSLEELEVKRSEFMVQLSQIRQETRVS